jgi:hypothetical protein
VSGVARGEGRGRAGERQKGCLFGRKGGREEGREAVMHLQMGRKDECGAYASRHASAQHEKESYELGGHGRGRGGCG